MACADVAMARANPATVINLIISGPPLHGLQNLALNWGIERQTILFLCFRRGGKTRRSR
jgi:hypothetical protein